MAKCQPTNGSVSPPASLEKTERKIAELKNLGGISVVNQLAQAHNRAGLLATHLVIGYVGTILPILGVGWLSDHVSLPRALLVFCTVFSVLAATLATVTWHTRPITIAING